MDKQQTKQEALEYLAQVRRGQRRQLEDIDGRLLTYYEGLTDGTMHNLYEVLGGIKFLRVLRTYPFSHKRVRHAIQLYEGRWNGDKYIEGSGGLQFSGLKGFTHYQLQPFQVFALAGLLGPMKDVDGDMRRLCTELVLYLTRKSGKTLMSAFIQFYGFFFMDSNFEGYCQLCRPSETLIQDGANTYPSDGPRREAHPLHGITDELEASATATGINHRTLCRWQDERWTLRTVVLC